MDSVTTAGVSYNNGASGTSLTPPGSGNDTINATFDEAGTNSTLNVFDTIDLAGGTNTLALSIIDTGGAGTTALGAASSTTLTNVNVLTIKGLAATSTEGDLTGIAPNLNTINFNASTAKYAVKGVSTAVKTVGISNVASDGADAKITFAAGLTGTADALTLNVSGASAATTSTAANFAEVNFVGAAGADGLEIINVVSSGSTANRLDVLAQATATTLKTVNVEGAAAFRVNTALANTVKTIDATKADGGVNLGVVAGANVTFTGGAGDDRINMAAGLETTDTLKGGAGSNTLAIDLAALTSTKTTAINKAIEAVTDFQKLEITTAATSGDTAIGVAVAANGLTTIKEFVFSGAGTGGVGTDATASAVAGAAWDAIQVTGLTSDNTNKIVTSAAITGGAGGAGHNSTGHGAGSNGGDAIELLPALNAVDAVTITVKGNLTGGNGGAGEATQNGNGGNGGHGINAAQFETLNLVSSGATATATNSITGGALGAKGGTGADGIAGFGVVLNTNATLNISGANDLTLTTSTVDPSAGGLTVNALTFTGKLNVTSSAGNDTIIGSTNENIIKAGAGRDSIKISASTEKADTIDLTDVVVAPNRDTITGFVAGAASTADKFSINDDATLGLKAITGSSTAFTIASTDDVTAFNFAGTNNSADLTAATDGAELFKAIASQGNTIAALTVTANDTGYLVAYSGDKAYLYYFADTGNGSLAATEVALIGVADSIAIGALVVGNFV